MLANGPKAEKAVGVFDGAFLPGAVGVGVVDGGADDAFEGGGAEELAPVVGEQRLHGLQLLLAHEFLEGGADGFLADFGEFDGVGFAGLAFGEGEEAALPASAGVDGVHFPDAEGLLAAEKGFGHVQDGVAGGAAFGNASFPLGGVDALAFALFRQPRGVHPGAGASCRDAVVNRFDARDSPVPPRRLPEDLRAILVIPKGRFQVLEGRRGGDFSFGTHERLERVEEGLREQLGVGVPLACFDFVVLEFSHIKREALELFVSEARRQTGLGAGNDVAERTVRDA